MKTTIFYKVRKLAKGFLPFYLFTLLPLITSCADFFEQESDQIIYADKDHLTSASDSIYSVTGILNKLQVLADRTVLLGEVRGDLTTITNVASSDLRDMALFQIGDDNQYNVPRDYYAVINNCNYFIAHVDTALKNNRNEYVFMKEYAAVKAIRAWTYLQLVLNYNRVPFVTEPILTKQEAEKSYPTYDLAAVCDYFIADLLPLAERYGREYPGYGTIRGNDSRFLWFPINIVLGDLYLWQASVTGNTEQYRQAALRYYQYISERNGQNSTYPVGLNLYTWKPGDTSWMSVTTWGTLGVNESYMANGELITMIPCDSTRSEGNYSELRNLFNSTDENDYKYSLTPSTRMEEISADQWHCCVGTNATSVIYAPKNLSLHRAGDLRLVSFWGEGYTHDKTTGERIETQTIRKYNTRNVHIYRRMMVYLRMAEALNMAGYPRMAFQILSKGLNNNVIVDDVCPYYSKSDSTWLRRFDFPVSRYDTLTAEVLVSGRTSSSMNTIGVHTRGSGYTPFNEYYQFPDSIVVDGQKQAVPLADQQEYVSQLLLTEEALEFAFEGTRFYDVMRFALRSSNPGEFMADIISARAGSKNVSEDIRTKLRTQSNWYLKWNGKIGPDLVIDNKSATQ
jgi:hypothetical protein